MLTPNKDSKIGLFDSGIGGLTVMQAIRSLLPNENIIYFGDTARVPYGNKSKDTIIRYSHENAQFLLKHNIKLLVIACNTASAWALEELQETYKIPIIGVIEPTIKQVSGYSSVAIIGTQGTIDSCVYQKKIQNKYPQTSTTGIPCPLFVPLVEENFLDHPATKLIVSEYLHPLLKQKPEALILGCTHYPILTPLIKDCLGKDIKLIDSAKACAKEAKETLQKLQILNNSDKTGVLQYYVSDTSSNFKKVGEHFLGHNIEKVSPIKF